MEGHNEIQSTSRGFDDLVDRIPTHFLVELTSLDELAFPANSTKRVKYTCVASTSKSLCLGTSTGSVYIFSRYAAKSRSRTTSPVPVQVFTTRDGLISTISCSPSEELMAIGGESGRVSVAQLNNGQPPTLLYSTPGDARSPDRVTALAWSSDLKTVYSGHSSGALHCHRLSNRSVFFRTAHQKLHKFDSEIVQIDTLQQHVLVATSLAAHLIHVESGSVQQVGKKTRTAPSALGARYIQPESDNGESAFIVAARPNGRLWEANLVGVVYRTHQYRQSSQISRAPPISFRTSFPTDPSQFSGLHPENQDVSLTRIHVIRSEDASGESRLLIVSTCGPRICIVEMETSRVICVAELDYDILDCATSSNDVFILLADSKGLRKFTVFERQKCVEKMNSKHLFLQSAQTILFCSPHIKFPTDLISQTIEGLATMSRKKETERLQGSLQSIMDDRKASESMYDNMEDERRRKNSEGISRKLPSGVHRVLHTGHCSGYDDDFSFSTPQALRERSRSSPAGPETPPTSIEKRASEPASLESRWRESGTPDVVEEDILHRARQILDNGAEKKFVEIESLRTLLQLEGVKRDEIRFTPTVTIGNAAKALAELALAVPVDVSTIWNKSEENLEEKSSKKPTIVKVVRPGIRPVEKRKPVATVSPRSHEDDVAEAKAAGIREDVEVNNVEISDEMRRKQDEMWLDLRLSHIKKQSQRSPTETVPKSDTDYTLTTDSDGPTPSATSDVIWTNPLEEEELATPTQDSSNCSTCQMHRSFATTALLMAVCGRAEVIRDEFRSHGSIPATPADWESLLRHIASRNSELDLTSICPRCEMSLSTVERVCNEAWRLTTGGMVEEGVRPNYERIFDRCMNTSKEKLEAIVSRSPEIENRTFVETIENKMENLKTKEKDRNETSSGVSENSFRVPPIPTTNHTEKKLLDSRNLRFLAAVPLKTLLSLAIFTIGKRAVLQIISSDQQFIAKRMVPADWSAIVVMGAREAVFKDLLATKTILSVLDSVGCTGWVIPRKIKSTPSITARKMSPTTSNLTSSPSSTSNISSWIVDSNGKCPICALPIKMIVGGTDRGLLTYQCGHCYHKMCLDGRSTIGCIACRARARRAANSVKNVSSATSSPTSSPLVSPRQTRFC